MRTKLPLGLVFILGFLGIIAYFIPHPVVRGIEDLMLYKILRIIGLFAIVLGLGSLFAHHFDIIKRKRERWQYSLVLFVTFIVSATVGLFGGMNGEGPLPTSIGGFNFDIQQIFNYVTVPLGATMFSLLAFYMSSAAYRAFHMRNLASALLLVAAFIVMLGVVPIGDIASRGLLSTVSQWIMEVPNTASKRGITFGVSVGIMATSMKIILGIERSWLGGEE